MDQPVDGRHGRHRILEDLFPLAENQVGTDQQTAPFVTLGKEGKQDFHLLAALLDVSEVIEDDGLEGVEFLKQSLQLEVILSL